MNFYRLTQQNTKGVSYQRDLGNYSSRPHKTIIIEKFT